MGLPETDRPDGAVDKSEEIIGTVERAVMGTYRREPIVLVRGKGSRVWDAGGSEYLDFVAGIAVNVLGHAHPRIVGAIAEQAEQLIHCSNLYYNEPQGRLAARLVELSPFDRAFFCNSGTEANEAAIKLARRWAYERAKRRGGSFEAPYEIVTIERSFHGRTLGALAATAQPVYQEGFGPLPGGFKSVPLGDVAALSAAISERTCAVMLEPIQGESGIHPYPAAYLQEVRRLCDERGVLLVVDEVQTGIGRTGRWFAFEHAGVVPDVCTLAKGLGGGVPIGAVLATEHVSRAFTPGTHGTTFGGNPLASRVACEVLQVIEDERLLPHADGVGAQLADGVRAIGEKVGVVRDVRGLGLMLGVELDVEAASVRDECRRRGLLVNAIGSSVIRLLPPLNVTVGEVSEALGILEEALLEVASRK